MNLYRIAIYVLSLVGVLIAAVLESMHWQPDNHRRAATALLVLGPGTLGWFGGLFFLREAAKEFKGTFEGPLRNLVGRVGFRVTDKLPVGSAAVLILFGGAGLLLSITFVVIKSLCFGD
jgi:hypothetical protein